MRYMYVWVCMIVRGLIIRNIFVRDLEHILMLIVQMLNYNHDIWTKIKIMHQVLKYVLHLCNGYVCIFKIKCCCSFKIYFQAFFFRKISPFIAVEIICLKVIFKYLFQKKYYLFIFQYFCCDTRIYCHSIY